jgi:hypothetical protein
MHVLEPGVDELLAEQQQRGGVVGAARQAAVEAALRLLSAVVRAEDSLQALLSGPGSRRRYVPVDCHFRPPLGPMRLRACLLYVVHPAISLQVGAQTVCWRRYCSPCLCDSVCCRGLYRLHLLTRWRP